MRSNACPELDFALSRVHAWLYLESSRLSKFAAFSQFLLAHEHQVEMQPFVRLLNRVARSGLSRKEIMDAAGNRE
jgi:hypothetical protein